MENVSLRAYLGKFNLYNEYCCWNILLLVGRCALFRRTSFTEQKLFQVIWCITHQKSSLMRTKLLDCSISEALLIIFYFHFAACAVLAMFLEVKISLNRSQKTCGQFLEIRSVSSKILTQQPKCRTLQPSLYSLKRKTLLESFYFRVLRQKWYQENYRFGYRKGSRFRKENLIRFVFL